MVVQFQPCKPGQIRNPKTGRCILINGRHPEAKKLKDGLIKLQKYGKYYINHKKAKELELQAKPKKMNNKNRFSKLPQDEFMKILEVLNKTTLVDMRLVSKRIKNNSNLKNMLKNNIALAHARSKQKNYDSFIKKVLKDIHPQLQADKSFINIVNSFFKHLLAIIMDKLVIAPITHGKIKHIDAVAVMDTFEEVPGFKDTYMMIHLFERTEIDNGLGKKIQKQMNNELKALGLYPQNSVKPSGANAVASVFDFICGEFCELAGNAARRDRKIRISNKHLRIAISSEEELSNIMRKIGFNY